MGAEACRQIAADRRHGTLELLLATPLSIRQIVTGQRLALQRQFALPILGALIVQAVLLGALLRDGSLTGSDRTMWVWLGLLAAVIFLLDLVAFFWLGLWWGLTARDGRRAYSRMIAAIFILPWVLYAAFIGLLAVGAFGPAHRVSWQVFVAVWFVFNVAVDAGFALFSRQRLLTEFRIRATERFQSRGRNPA